MWRRILPGVVIFALIGCRDTTGPITPPASARSTQLVRIGDFGVTVLGTLGGSSSIAYDINENGVIVGTSYDASGAPRAFIYAPSGEMVDLGTPPSCVALPCTEIVPTAINNLGEVVGYGRPGGGSSLAFYWNPVDGFIEIGTLGGSYSQATDINDSGEVVGSAANYFGHGRAFRWTRSEGIRDLGLLPGCCYTAANGINNAGQIVGISAGQAVVWSVTGEITALVGGEAHDLNESGQIVGTTAGVAFIWSPTDGFKYLGTTPGGTWTEGYGISEAGHVVGKQGRQVGQAIYSEGFVWTSTKGLVLLPPYTGDCCVLARAINDAGVIAGGSVDRATLWAFAAENQPPQVSDVLVQPNPVLVGSGVTLSATIAEVGVTNGVIRVAAYRIDGGAPQPMNSQDGAFDEPLEVVTANLPAFSTAGAYQVCVEGTDDSGNVSASQCVGLDVSDPSAGDVIGTGRIDSPAGACRLSTCSATTTGQAMFKLAAKLEPGAVVPSGNSSFDLKAGNLQFQSSSYSSLVITGARVQVTGKGTINGAGNYGFLITAVDGQPDRYRIKIWDLDAANVVVYDNEMGATDGAEPVTSLRSGSIVVTPSR